MDDDTEHKNGKRTKVCNKKIAYFSKLYRLLIK